MLKHTKFIFPLLFFTTSLFAQQSSWFTIDRAYKTGLELLEKRKYAAASEQFARVENHRLTSSAQPQEGEKLSLMKENAYYYQALCALELGNTDAEARFLRFIADYPASPNTKMAYYQVGRSYFNQKNYAKTIEWLNKID
jgi:TolA-binding protein